MKIVNETLTSTFQCVINKFCNFLEVHCNVRLGNIEKFESLVFDAERFVKVRVGIHRALPGPLGSVEDMSNTNLLEVKCVLRSTSEKRK